MTNDQALNAALQAYKAALIEYARDTPNAYDEMCHWQNEAYHYAKLVAVE